MSFLIIGANGLIGCDLVRILSKNNKVVAVYRKNKDRINVHKNITLVKHNFNKKLKLKFKPKYIINCLVDETYKKKNSKKYIKRNILIAKNIVDFAKKKQVDLIFNLSSVDVYGEVEKNIITENILPKNQSDYGFMKYKIEKLIANSNCNYFNLRIPGTLCYGSKNIIERPWINASINKILKNKNITIYNPNQKFNNVTSSLEIAKFINYIVKRKIYNHTLNFATKLPVTVNEIIKFIQKKINPRCKINKIYNKKNNGFYISIKKMEKKTNFKTLSTKKLITKFLNFIKYDY